MSSRNFQIDIIRCVALFLIIFHHSHYFNFDGTLLIFTKLKWFIGKVGVPLFLIISGYLNLPLKFKLPGFLKKKFTRVFFPFLFWCFVYGIISLLNHVPILIGDLFLNGYSAHLWFIYAIIAIYLVSPVISNYFNTCNRRDFKFYLFIWILSLFIPYITKICNWSINQNNIIYTFYYCSGYLGYYILGFYIKRFKPSLFSSKFKFKKFFPFIIGVPFVCLIFMYLGFYKFNFTTDELSNYLSVIPFLLSLIFLFILFRIKSNITIINKIIKSIAIYSFGIYLFHMVIVIYGYPLCSNFVHKLNGLEFFFFNTILAIVNLIISYFIVKIISYIPYSKYIIG